ncbi:hypothetical protein [Rheinheimera maricola]|uniref:Uncharacterized protein n=1 Tax=Rheinheimera maricola TaxID=2793282 RepID=A0ABS7XBC9_9GAMM|nr:hypothetical protein [Rheinheimera maricola]MBZ9612847.1 hypothetical protein [Rheinheimera maricola]
MNILPLKGTDELQFGTHKSDILKSLGKPDSIENLDAKDEVSSEIYYYDSMGLGLYFDKDTGFRLWGLSISDHSVQLNGFFPIGMSETDLLKAFPTIVLDVSDGEFKEYLLPEQEVEFYLKGDVVQRIMLSPDLEKYCVKYSC